MVFKVITKSGQTQFFLKKKCYFLSNHYERLKEQMFFYNPLLDVFHKNKCSFVYLKLHQAIIEMNYVMRYKDCNL